MDGIVFYRYFDRDSGRLLLTDTEGGVRIKELNDIVVDGIRFPSKMITKSQLKNGEARTVTVVFDKITVNETFADSLFAVPILER